jgi:N-acyl-L-homoserine lactone synthetase
MENITFELSGLHRYGSAYFDYLALRKKFFVDTLGWGIPHNAKFEMDQYDNPLARYSLVLQDGEVVAGARAMPTSAVWGSHTYMLGDAVSGKLSTIPSDVIDQEISTTNVWECTRLVIAEHITAMPDRIRCLELIVDGLIDMAEDCGADKLISLSNLWLLRALRQLGYAADLMGKPYVNADDGHKYAVMAIGTERQQIRLPRPTHHVPTHHLGQPQPLHAPA